MGRAMPGRDGRFARGRTSAPAAVGTEATDLLRRSRSVLKEANIATPDLDARLLFEHATGLSRLDLVRDPKTPVPEEKVAALHALLARRIAGESVHRILGWREFHGLRLALSPDTLEPRPDTEILVDAALPFVRAIADAKGQCRVLDLGTGTGAIALAILAVEPHAHATATDIAPGALATARANAEAHGLSDRLETIEADWMQNVAGQFDAILSNPPYIRADDIPRLAPDVRDHDPLRALDGGTDGLDAYRAIAADAAAHLASGGVVGVEIGYDQADSVEAIFAEAGYRTIGRHRDLGGNDRVLLFAR